MYNFRKPFIKMQNQVQVQIGTNQVQIGTFSGRRDIKESGVSSNNIEHNTKQNIYNIMEVISLVPS